MLPRIVLILLQIACAWTLMPKIMSYIPIGGDIRNFVIAIVFAVVVWVVGLIGAEVLKDTARPSGKTLTASLIVALIGAALFFVPGLMQAIPYKFNDLYVPLAGAILGYVFVK